MLLNSSVKIDTQSVNSGNKGRDIKLVSYFFNIQDVKFIKAKIVEIKNSNIIVKISMNSKSLNIPMSYKVQNNTIIANGTIDLADFDMLTSLSAINKACYTLHQGKTWQDVNISFEIKYK
jgi:polyisoprenoid-binding protein YceI